MTQLIRYIECKNKNHLSRNHIMQGLTLVEAGGGSKCPIGQEIGSHFSQDHPMVTKFLDFIHKHLSYEILFVALE